MAYSATHIAKHILLLSNPDIGDLISNLKLQKLLYYSQCYHLAMYDKPLFNEDIYAWQYGPVVPDVYHEYKHLGPEAIAVPEEEVEPIDAQSSALIKEIYEVFGQFSALKLMEMTHNETPWKTTQMNEIIGLETMKDFFIPFVIKD